MITLIIIIILVVIFSNSSSGSGSSNSSNTSYSNSTSRDSSNTSYSNSTSSNSSNMNKSNAQAKTVPITTTSNKSIEKSSNPKAHAKQSNKQTPTKNTFNEKVRLTGVTYDDRQYLISRMHETDRIYVKRVYNNSYDRNAIGVFNRNNENVGWIPRDIASNLAPKMDRGVSYYACIHKKLGGNGYNYGLELLLSDDQRVIDDHTRRVSNRNKKNSYVPYAVAATATAAATQNYSTRYYDEAEYDEERYSIDDYFVDESFRGDDDYDPSNDWTDLYEYNENH